MEQQCNNLQLLMVENKLRMGAKIRELESQPEQNVKARAQKVDSLLATIPSESTVNECT